MRETENLKLKMPEKNEYINIADINENTEKIDNELAKKADASGGDISETVITSTETSQAEYPVPAAGDSAKTILGKVQKFFGDLRNWMTGVCLLGQIVNNCVTDNAKLPLSAAQGKVLMDLYNVLNTNSLKASTFNARPEAKYYGYSIPFTTAATTIGDICDILGARNGYIMLDTAAPINPMQGYYTIVELRAYNAVIIATAKSRIGIWGGQATNTTWSGWTKL